MSMPVEGRAAETRVRLAVTPAEREQVFRLRYQVYVEEMHLPFPGSADHGAQAMSDEVDDVARLVLVTVDDRPAGTLRAVLGSDGPIPPVLHEEFHLERFIDLVAPERMLFLSRFLVHADYRQTDVTVNLIRGLQSIWEEQRPELVFGDCEPYMLAFYDALGFRTYCSPYNTVNMDLLYPLVLVVDHEYLEGIGSPLLEWGARDLPEPAALAALRERVPAIAPARPLDLQGDEWAAEFERLSSDRGGDGSIFAGLRKDEVDALLARSQVLDLEPGALLIRRDNVSRNMYVVLDGALEIFDGERMIRTCGKGEVVGDVAFLLRSLRTADAIAGPDGARVVGISERALHKLIESQSRVAAVFLLNLARSGASRLVSLGEHDN